MIVTQIDIFTFTELILLIGTDYIAIMKYMVYVTKRKTMKKMFMMINDLYTNAPIEENEKLKNVSITIQKELKSVLKGLSIGFAIFVLYAIAPFITFIKTGKLIPAYHVKYSFDISSWPMFLFIYVTQNFTAFTIVVSFVCESLFGAVMNITCGRFDMLLESIKLKIENVDELQSSKYSLKDCILYQKRIYK